MQNLVNVQPIALSDNCVADCCDVCVAGNNITVAGWGALENGQLPINLMQVSKPLFDHTVCNSIWTGITANMFCTAVEGGRDSCGGKLNENIFSNI